MELFMKYGIMKICFIESIILMTIASANDGLTASVSKQLPPLETFIIEPIELEHISVWIPAAKAGPFINSSCMPETDCSYSCVLPATVNHTKTDFCPDGVARLLAEYTARYHEQTLPLTIFNGWQWEYSYSLSQFETSIYELPKRGGNWEGSWEAILTYSIGSVEAQWLQISPLNNVTNITDDNRQKSHIEVRTFDSLRTRDGYPKERPL
jgi:hypothetical protein